jgi:hypothetical protein
MYIKSRDSLAEGEVVRVTMTLPGETATISNASPVSG